MAEAAQIEVPFAESIFKLLLKLTDFIEAANNVFVVKEQFNDFAKMVERMKPVLYELKDKNAQSFSENIKGALYTLDVAMTKALELSHSCRSGSTCLLLLKCPEILKKIDNISKEIGFCLDALSLANLEFSFETSARVVELRDLMKNAEFKAASDTEAIITKLQDAFREEHSNSQKVLQVLVELAKVTGASVNSFVEHEIETVKKEKVELEEQKNQNEAHFLEQVIAFLYRSEMVPSASMDSGPYEHLPIEEVPMKAFLCPLTGMVMDDPVDISSGYTFERRAIREWFDEGNKTCPVCNLTLKNFDLHSNVSLLESIKEWKERIAISRLEKAAREIQFVNWSEMDEYLSDLLGVILEVRGDVAVDHIIPQLVTLPRRYNGDNVSIKSKAMKCLSSLAGMGSRYKELVAYEDGVNLAVECLAEDDAGIRAQGVALLLELSRENKLCDTIGKAKNCIPQLVALTNSQDALPAGMAQVILANLACVIENLKCICEANYFKPLLDKLTHGSIHEKVQMAMLLGKTTLTDYSRASLVQQGVLPPLVHLFSERSPAANQAVLTAIKNLVRHSDVRAAVLTTEVVKPMVEILLSRETANNSSSCHEMASGILASLAMPIPNSVAAEADALESASLAVLQEKETIHGLILLLATTDAPSSFKVNLLQILLAVATMKAASAARKEMQDAEAIQLLLSLCDERDAVVRLHTFRLMSNLIEDDNGHHLVDSLEEKHVTSFVMVLSDLDVEVVLSVLDIMSKFPVHDPRIMDFLIRSQALPKVMEILVREDLRPLRERDRLIEGALGVFLLFLVSPSPSLLEQLTQFELTALLVRILDHSRPLARQRAATALAWLSGNTMSLSRPVAQTRSSKFFCCWGQATIHACTVHGKICSARESFCLVKANAIAPLVKTLGEKECSADAAALGALETLLGVESDTWGPGMKAIKEARGLAPIIRLLTTGSQQAQEQVLTLLEKLTTEREYTALIGKTEEMELIQLMQQGSHPIKKLAAKILGNSGKIPLQSTYF